MIHDGGQGHRVEQAATGADAVTRPARLDGFVGLAPFDAEQGFQAVDAGVDLRLQPLSTRYRTAAYRVQQQVQRREATKAHQLALPGLLLELLQVRGQSRLVGLAELQMLLQGQPGGAEHRRRQHRPLDALEVLAQAIFDPGQVVLQDARGIRCRRKGLHRLLHPIGHALHQGSACWSPSPAAGGNRNSG
jgi:hypothetical protein